MDPLTHTLVGANLASTRLGEKTRFAVAALVVGANAPDIDVFSYAFGRDAGIGFRRGWTHGILAIVVLPFILTGILVLIDRWRPRAGLRASPKILLGLSAIAVFTHPCLDWLNNYGMRWLMPFRHTWTYGDSVFIADPWLWMILGAGWLIGRKPTFNLVVTWAVVSVLIGFAAWGRGMHDLAIVAIVSVILLGALLARSAGIVAMKELLASAALVLATMYILSLISIHAATVSRVRDSLVQAKILPIDALMVGPMPLDPRTWDVVVELPKQYRTGHFDWRDGKLHLDERALSRPKSSPLWDAVRTYPTIRGFMSWVRFPWYDTEKTDSGIRVWVMDARYTRTRVKGFGGVVVDLPGVPPAGAK